MEQELLKLGLWILFIKKMEKGNIFIEKLFKHGHLSEIPHKLIVYNIKDNSWYKGTSSIWNITKYRFPSSCNFIPLKDGTLVEFLPIWNAWLL